MDVKQNWWHSEYLFILVYGQLQVTLIYFYFLHYLAQKKQLNQN